MNEELEQMLLGKKLGSGIHRAAYVYNLDESCVIKVATDEYGRGANVLEHKLWWELENWDDGKKWFAPVIALSDGGKYLVMKRAQRGRDVDYPEKVPSFFTDLKRDNFGFIGKQLVCVDYASCLMLTDGWKIGRTKKAGWW